VTDLFQIVADKSREAARTDWIFRDRFDFLESLEPPRDRLKMIATEVAAANGRRRLRLLGLDSAIGTLEYLLDPQQVCPERAWAYERGGKSRDPRAMMTLLSAAVVDGRVYFGGQAVHAYPEPWGFSEVVYRARDGVDLGPVEAVRQWIRTVSDDDDDDDDEIDDLN
jgi:hypothetical protein